jgi:hypothetical protein
MKLHSVAWLTYHVPRLVAAFDKGDLSQGQAICGLLTDCIITLTNHPDDINAMRAIVDGIPCDLFNGMVEHMTRLPTPDGRWDWPPGGILTNPGGLISWQSPIPEIRTGILKMRWCVEQALASKK